MKYIMGAGFISLLHSLINEWIPIFYLKLFFMISNIILYMGLNELMF